MADRHYGLSRGQNQSSQATAMSPVPDVDVRINFDNGITRHEVVAALDVIKQAVLEDKWPPVDPSVPSSGSAVEDRTLWLREREAFLRPIIQGLNGNPLTFNTAGGAAAFAAAVEQARAANRPLKLEGSTPLDLTPLGNDWRPKSSPTDPAPLTIYSETGVRIVGETRIRLQQYTRWINLRFENAQGSGAGGDAFFPDIDGKQVHCQMLGCVSEPRANARHIYAILGSGGAQEKFLFRFNEFINGTYTLFGFSMNDSEFSDNRSTKNNQDDRHFHRVGGYRNRFLRNYMYSGRTGIVGLFDHSTTTWTNSPFQQCFVDDLIEGNFFDLVEEESFGYDIFGTSASQHPCLTYTEVLGTSGSASSNPVLSCSYNGVASITASNPTPWRMMLVMTGPHAGKFAQVRSLAVNGSNVDMTIQGIGLGVTALKPGSGSNGRRAGDAYFGELVQEDFATLTGAIVMLCDLSVGAVCRNNVFRQYPFNGTGQGAISMWGGMAGYEISGNRFIDISDGSIAYSAIKCDCPSGIAGKATAAGQPNWGNRFPAGQNLVLFPAARGRIFNNDCGGLQLLMQNTGYSDPSHNFFNGTPVSYPVMVFNNYNCRGGGPVVRNWRGINGIEYSPATPVYDTSSTWIFNNS